MRHPHRWTLHFFCLCGVMILAGCNHYGPRLDITAGADAPAGGAPVAMGLRAQFDIPAILDELVGPASPYCPVGIRPGIGSPLAGGPPGSLGVCVVEVAQEEAAAVLKGATPSGKASGYLP